MNSISIWFTFSLVFSLVLFRLALPKPLEEKVNIGKLTIPLLFLLALALRIVLATSYSGFGADISCFSAWSDRMVTIGPANFYAEDYFSDYPPLYLYILFLVGRIKKVFSINTFSALHLLLLKSPSILADLGIGYVIYKAGTKRLGLRSAIWLTSLFLFQPAVLLNSCLWGQVDSIFTLLLIMVCLYLERQNLFPAMWFFGLGVLMKPQMLIFAPILILGVIHYVFRGSFSMRMFAKALAYGLLTLIYTILLAMPFGMENVISQYVDTLASCPYASVNAYNFWSAVGLNWRSQDTIFCGMPCTAWGFIAIVLAASFAVILGLRLGNLYGKYFVVGAFLIVTMFTFSVRMHERYLYPVIPLMILGFIGFASRQLRTVPTMEKQKEDVSWSLSPALCIGYPIVFTFLTALHFFNTAYVLFYYDPATYSSSAPHLKIAGLAMTLAALSLYLLLFRLQTRKELALRQELAKVNSHSIRANRNDPAGYPSAFAYHASLLLFCPAGSRRPDGTGNRICSRRIRDHDVYLPGGSRSSVLCLLYRSRS